MRGVKVEGCLIKGCLKKHAAKGYCTGHYKQARVNGEFGNEKPCKEEDCFTVALYKGYCEKHYTRFYRHGDAKITLPKTLNNLIRHPIEDFSPSIENYHFSNERELFDYLDKEPK